MSRLLWVSLILLLILPRPILAQQPPPTGCERNAPAAVASTVPKFNTACQTYFTCLSDGTASGICQARALFDLQVGCADTACTLEAQLATAAIAAYGTNYTADDFTDASQVVWDAISKGLLAFHAGKYADALAAYQSIPVNVHTDATPDLSAGTVYEIMDDDASAFTRYDHAAQFWYNAPLVYYALGNLNLRRGHPQEAAVDYSLMSTYIGRDTYTENWMDKFTSDYSLDDIHFENWLAYPVLLSGGGVVGGSYTDETLSPPRAVNLTWIDNQSTAVAQNLADDLFTSLYQDLPDPLILRPSPDKTFQFSIQYTDDYGSWGGTLSFNRFDNPVVVSENVTEFEGGGSSTFLLAPSGQFDPRRYFAEPRCPAAALSRLKIGGQASSTNYNNSITLYDQPSGSKVVTNIAAYASFTVLDGPRCIPPQAWWQVKTDDGQTGWVSESNYSQYLVYPIDDTPIPPHCDAELPPHLMIGGHGSVIPDQGANNIRSAATTSATRIGIIPEGGLFDVLMGPVCADGYAWWQIRYNGIVGWTAESKNVLYWLKPEIAKPDENSG